MNNNEVISKVIFIFIMAVMVVIGIVALVNNVVVLASLFSIVMIKVVMAAVCIFAFGWSLAKAF